MNLFQRSCKLYPMMPYLERKHVWTLRAEWIRKVKMLGDRWLLAKPVMRIN